MPVYDAHGTAYPLAAVLGSGGQGTVSEVAGQPRLVVKRFSDPVLQGAQGGPLRQKVAALQAKQLHLKLPQAAWPQFEVFAGRPQRQWCGYAMRRVEQWCGYAMRRVDGLPLLPALLLNPLRLEKRYPAIRRPELAELALAFLTAAELLQGEGVAIGDYNPQNFRFDPASRELGFIDTDAFQVSHQGGLFVCPVTAAELTPPEYLNDPVKWRWRNPENELFAAAILTFLILTPGLHPYQTLQADNCAANLRAGRFPYRPLSGSAGPPTGLVPLGIWEQVWADFPASLQERFTAIFLTGHAAPDRRGTLAGLRQAVAEYAEGLRQGRHQVMPLLGAPLPPAPAARPQAGVRRPWQTAAPAAPPAAPPAALPPAAPPLRSLVQAHTRAVGRLLLRLLIF